MKIKSFLIGKAKVEGKERVTMSMKMEDHALIGYKVISAEIKDDSLLILLEER